jgi:hypothetical protein
VEIALSIPAVLVVLAASLFISTYARNQVSVEEDLLRAVTLCSRGLPTGSAEACVRTALEGRLTFCDGPTIETEVQTFDRTYNQDDHPGLAVPIRKTLGLLRGQVSCSMDITVWQYISRTVEFTAQVAMPVRLETETRP